MEELEKQYLVSYYDGRVRLLGETPGALGWSPAGQRARYEAALELFGRERLDGARLADYGCGLGDFYGFLLEKGVSGARYHGFDINPGLVEIARRRYPGGTFSVLDIDLSPLPCDFDFSLICGVFNQRLEGAIPAGKRCMGRIWAQTGKALFFDALSADSGGRDISLQYWSPGDLFDFAAALPRASAALFEALASRGNLVLFLERDACPKS
ncbi:MAG: class I SAM-dependent methyltransferase [Nitrospiraceae bacterium]|nr:class I SAM-dependent methyltransferase [Nitrospiraceae bacterium]